MTCKEKETKFEIHVRRGIESLVEKYCVDKVYDEHGENKIE